MSDKFKIVERLFSFATFCLVLFLAIYVPLNLKKEIEIENSVEIVESVSRDSETSILCKNAAVATDSTLCSSVGKKILKMGGNAVDAGIVTASCLGLQNFHSCGIGGGSFFMVYNDLDDQTFINCREKAPAAASEEMFVKNPENSTYGGLSIAIPSEMACLAEAHTRYGSLEWSLLIDEIVTLLENGIIVTTIQEKPLADHAEKCTNAEMFFNDDGQIKKAGDVIYNSKLADTFRKIGKDKNAFFKGALGQDVVDDIQENGGIITIQDLTSYEPNVEIPKNIDIGDLRFYIPSAPSSGPVFQFIFNIFANFEKEGILPTDQIDFNHRLIEAFKFAYGKRSALGDPKFITNQTTLEMLAKLPTMEFAKLFADKIDDETHLLEFYEPEFEIVEDSGTSHMSIVDANGMAVAITSTINTILGSKMIGKRTGILFNNEMDDFSTPGVSNTYGLPPSPSNFIKPGAQPLSSMCPIIVVDKNSGKVIFTAGASGGSQITTATANVAIRTLLYGDGMNEAIQKARIHHQLLPNEIRKEDRFDLKMIQELEKRGHVYYNGTGRGAVVQGILRRNGVLEAVSDVRKGGKPDGY